MPLSMQCNSLIIFHCLLQNFVWKQLLEQLRVLKSSVYFRKISLVCKLGVVNGRPHFLNQRSATL